LVEDFDFLFSEPSIEDLKVLAVWCGKYLRDRRLPVKRLLFKKALFAKTSLAP
jgi:hypothetical protein